MPMPTTRHRKRYKYEIQGDIYHHDSGLLAIAAQFGKNLSSTILESWRIDRIPGQRSSGNMVVVAEVGTRAENGLCMAVRRP